MSWPVDQNASDVRMNGMRPTMRNKMSLNPVLHSAFSLSRPTHLKSTLKVVPSNTFPMCSSFLTFVDSHLAPPEARTAFEHTDATQIARNLSTAV